MVLIVAAGEEINLSDWTQFHGPGARFTKRSLFANLDLITKAEGKKLMKCQQNVIVVDFYKLSPPFKGREINLCSCRRYF